MVSFVNPCEHMELIWFEIVLTTSFYLVMYIKMIKSSTWNVNCFKANYQIKVIKHITKKIVRKNKI
jgi:hypothetical protein